MLLKNLSKYDKLESGLDYHDTLHPQIWDENQRLHKDVDTAIQRIADKFIEFLGVADANVADVILTGSVCNYNWTKFSDIDLHILLDYNAICGDCSEYNFDDCMKAKKTLWNDKHDITIHGLEVEVYAQPKDDAVTGDAGVYSLKTSKWLKKPEKKNVSLDDKMIMYKAKRIMWMIDQIIENKVDNESEITDLKDYIKKMRKSGLEKYGEYGLENLVFKALRNTGYIQKLHDYAQNVEDKGLSL